MHETNGVTSLHTITQIPTVLPEIALRLLP